MARRQGPKEWSPITKHTRKLIANIGDRTPLEYGGHLIYFIRDPDYVEYRSVYFDEPVDGEYIVYRWRIEKDVLNDLNWLDEENVQAIAESISLTANDLKLESVDQDVRVRARLYQEVGRYWGFENLDGYPERYSEEQMLRYFPEVKTKKI